jgi:hypothetical protein
MRPQGALPEVGHAPRAGPHRPYAGRILVKVRSTRWGYGTPARETTTGPAPGDRRRLPGPIWAMHPPAARADNLGVALTRDQQADPELRLARTSSEIVHSDHSQVVRVGEVRGTTGSMSARWTCNDVRGR